MVAKQLSNHLSRVKTKDGMCTSMINALLFDFSTLITLLLCCVCNELVHNCVLLLARILGDFYLNFPLARL